MSADEYSRWEILASKFDVEAEGNLTLRHAWRRAAVMIRDEIELIRKDEQEQTRKGMKWRQEPGA
jgi:hypothetical protein